MQHWGTKILHVYVMYTTGSPTVRIKLNSVGKGLDYCFTPEKSVSSTVKLFIPILLLKLNYLNTTDDILLGQKCIL